jgi:predicted nucleic acid-binding Zn ribbon protein
MEPIQDLLHPVVASLLRPSPLSPAKVQCAWHLAVGSGLARVAEVVLNESRILDVRVEDARWKAELSASRTLILGRLRAVLGADAVADIRITAPRAGAGRRARRPGPVAPLPGLD